MWVFGTHVENEMNEAEKLVHQAAGKNKTASSKDIEKARMAAFRSIVPALEGDIKTVPKGRFADPASMVQRR